MVTKEANVSAMLLSERVGIIVLLFDLAIFIKDKEKDYKYSSRYMQGGKLLSYAANESIMDTCAVSNTQRTLC